MFADPTERSASTVWRVETIPLLSPVSLPGCWISQNAGAKQQLFWR
jgi:hypothetical protein